MAVTRDGIPVRCWTFPGNTADQMIIRKVKDDLARLEPRPAWSGCRPRVHLEANRAYLPRAAGITSSPRSSATPAPRPTRRSSRQGRYHTVAGNLRVKEVRVDDRDAGDGERFVVCHNPEQAERDQLVRGRPRGPPGRPRSTAPTRGRSRRRDELAGALAHQARATPLPAPHHDGLLRIDNAAIAREAKLDGKWLLRTNDESLTPDDLAARLQAAYRSRTRLAGHEGHARAAPRLPPPRGPHPQPTSSSAGWRCCSSGSSRPQPATPGATSATSSTGCTSSPSRPPTAGSPSAPRPPPASGHPARPRPRRTAEVPRLHAATPDLTSGPCRTQRVVTRHDQAIMTSAQVTGHLFLIACLPSAEVRSAGETRPDG